jgi:hypothetical protein
MEFNYRYLGNTAVDSSATSTSMSMAPDTFREPTYFSGELRQHVAFREVISALHDVVVSDLRTPVKDKTAYKAWAAQQEQLDWTQIAAQRGTVKGQLEDLGNELEQMRKGRQQRWAPFYRARQRYYDYLYQKDRDAWFVLDPVITVHPDEIFFECFSQDESSYGRVGANYEIFQNIGEFACGTTNIDYSDALYNEFQKIRSYKSTKFEVDKSGFDVETTGEDAYHEVKIDLPDSWVRGFLQVSSAMTLEFTSFDLHPMDVHNLCFVLRRHREIRGPRSLRFQLKNGHPVKVIFDPWGIEIECPRSIYHGPDREEIRVWGRRRIHILERLIPVADKFTVHLLGKGMPYFFVAQIGDLNFTLGLSGWTANDWSKSGNFDLMAPRTEVDDFTKRRVFEGLKESWSSSSGDLAKKLDLDEKVVLGALGAYTQAGRVMFDVDKNVYRVRELSKDPLPMDKLRFANEREQTSNQLCDGGFVKVASHNVDGRGNLRLHGRVRQGGRVFEPNLVIDKDEALREGSCTCNFYQQNRLRMGPCEHMLATRIQHRKDTN